MVPVNAVVVPVAQSVAHKACGRKAACVRRGWVEIGQTENQGQILAEIDVD